MPYNICLISPSPLAGANPMPSLLGDKIRAARTALNMSLDQLATQTGSSKSYVWELENKDNPNPSAEKLAKFAKELGVTSEFLRQGTEISADDEVKDLAFFRKFQGLDPKDKERLRKFVDVWDDEK